jgi:hypothetical protein
MTAEPLHADMAAVRSLGGAFDAHAAELGAVAAALRSVPSSESALGPIGERFMTALHAAIGTHIDAVTAASVRVGAGAVNAGANASSYDVAGQQAAARLPRV